jgi:hypothetical protein
METLKQRAKLIGLWMLGMWFAMGLAGSWPLGGLAGMGLITWWLVKRWREADTPATRRVYNTAVDYERQTGPVRTVPAHTVNMPTWQGGHPAGSAMTGQRLYWFHLDARADLPTGSKMIARNVQIPSPEFTTWWEKEIERGLAEELDCRRVKIMSSWQTDDPVSEAMV